MNTEEDKRIMLDQRIKNLLFYKKRIQKNSTSSKILEMLYHSGKNYTVQQITSKIDKPYIYTKKIVLQLQSNGYLYNDEKRYNKSHRLSKTGRWFAICILFDYISFQSLCILAATYSRVKRDPKNPHTGYLVSKFRSDFDKSCDADETCASAIYTNSNILKSIKQLTDRNLLYWANDEFLKISPAVFEKLSRYDEDFKSLVQWHDKVYEKCKDEYLNSMMFGKENRQIFALASVPLA